jgi:type IV pilus assembly protein PilM
MAQKQISLYIDDSAIYLMVSKGREPQKWSSLALTAEVVKDGVIRDRVAFQAKIKELFESVKMGRLKGKRVAVAASGVNCMYQVLTLPDLPEDLLGEAIAREANHALGIEVEEVYLSWQVLSVVHGQMSVYLAVMPRDMVDNLVGTLREVGLKPYLMDLKPLCLARMSSEPRAILVDTQPWNFDLVVLSDGVPEVVRSLNFPEEAAPGEKAALVRSELERAIMYYNSSHMDKPIDLTVPILLSGDIVHQEDDWAVLAGPRQRPVQILEPQHVAAPEGFEASRYMANMGMALKEVLEKEEGAIAFSLVNFNALPAKYLPLRRSNLDAVLVPVAVAGVILIGAGIFAMVYINNQNDGLRDDIAVAEERIDEQQVSSSQITALTTQVSGAEGGTVALSGALDALDADRGVLADHLVQIYAALPVGVSLNTVSMGAEGVTLSGIAADEFSMFDYAWSLRDGGYYSSVILTNISVGDGGIAFSMVLTE